MPGMLCAGISRHRWQQCSWEAPAGLRTEAAAPHPAPEVRLQAPPVAQSLLFHISFCLRTWKISLKGSLLKRSVFFYAAIVRLLSGSWADSSVCVYVGRCFPIHDTRAGKKVQVIGYSVLRHSPHLFWAFVTFSCLQLHCCAHVGHSFQIPSFHSFIC